MCERDSVCRRSERDSVETGREGKHVTVHSANAETQLRDALRRFDDADNIARYVGFRLAWSGREPSWKPKRFLD